MTSHPKWPLHPRPSELDILREYVKRLACLYGVGYSTFCVNALGISPTDREALSLRDPSDVILERLSAGIGVPVSGLRKLHPDTIFSRQCSAIKILASSEEGVRIVRVMEAFRDEQKGIP